MTRYANDVTNRLSPESLALPKWPALAVEGNPVTKEQAAEILIRTDDLYFSCNDHAWKRQLYVAAGIELDSLSSSLWTSPRWESIKAARQRLGCVDLEYLHNHRIASSFIGGPHGWCDWDGVIGCNSFNIGRWPSVAVVFREWQAIAKAFPYLSLRAQLYSGESCEENIYPLVEYTIKDGVASLSLPGEPISLTPSVVEDLVVSLLLPASVRERGCTLDTFKRALQIVEEARQ